MLTAEFWSPASNALVFLSTAAVLIGLILKGEWEWSLPLFFHQSVGATRPLSDWQKPLGQTLVTLGVAGELLFGVTAFVTTSMVDSRQKGLLAAAITEQTNLERLIAGRQIIAGPALAKLRKFAGTPLWVSSIDKLQSFPKYNTIYDVETSEKISEEAQRFADSFSEVENVAGWKFHRINDPIPEASRFPGVAVYSWPVSQDKLNDPQRKTWAAGDALVAYLKNDLRLARTVHKPLQVGSRVIPPFDKWTVSPPLNAVVVLVGESDPQAELKEWLRQRRHIP